MAIERLGQWRKGLSSMSFLAWSRSAASASKVMAAPVVDPADIDIELADFQGMPRSYDSGYDSEDLLSSSNSVCSSLSGTSPPQHALQPSAAKTAALMSSPLDTDCLLSSS